MERNGEARPAADRLEIAAVAVASCSAIVFLAMAANVGPSSLLTGFDMRIQALLRAFRGPLLDRALWAFTLLGDPLVASALGVSAVVLLVLWGKRLEALLVAITVGGGAELGTIVKQLVGRVRPPTALALVGTPDSSGFPSGHALFGVLFAGSVLFVLLPRVKTAGRRGALLALGLAAAFLVGVSRAYLGVHWPSDVLAAWCLGAAWLGATCGAFMAYVRRARTVSWPTLGSRRLRRLAAWCALLLVAASLAVTGPRDPLLAGLPGYAARRPMNMLTTNTMSAMTSSVWMKLPPTLVSSPRSQSTSRTPITVHSISLTSLPRSRRSSASCRTVVGPDT